MSSQKMDNYQGDLTDIIRATSRTVRSDGDTAAEESAAAWHFPSKGFGDPFIHFRDPLLHDIETPPKVSKFEAVLINEELKRPPDIFSRMLQISPDSNPPAPPPRHLAVDSPGGLQISSPRNAGIKRRKNQAKKVVCIPAPAPANSRPSGEIVPSDLWAWRKYGQKPIKGSPYPRGYYRCSSSKGCSARKQVERSRTDPNMLVITYTSEHNHPWPTQRNALAGSTRSQPSKNATKNQQTCQRFKEEIKPENAATTSTAAVVKQEGIDTEYENGIQNSYKPALPDSSNSEDNFFTDLGGIETDSLDILFAQGFSGDEGRVNEDLDPFNFYDWHESNNNNISTIPSTEDKRDS